MNSKKDLSKEKLAALDFRRTRLCGRMQRLDAMLFGRDASLLPEVRNEDGEYDEDKTRRLADALADAVERLDSMQEEDSASGLPDRESAFYRKMIRRAVKDGVATSSLPAETEIESPERRFMRWYRQPDPAPPDTAGQKADKREFYRSFFYCALRVVECGPFWLKETSGSYDDLLGLARELNYTEAAELHFLELYDRKGPGGTFGLMDDLYADLSGRFITEELSPDECRRARSLHPDKAVRVERLRSYRDADAFGDLDAFFETSEEDMRAAQEYYDSLTDEEKARDDEERQKALRALLTEEFPETLDWDGQDPLPEFEQFDPDGISGAQAYQEYLDSLPEEERQRMIEEDMWYAQAEQTRYGRLQNFLEKESFCQEYLRFRKLYFSLPDRRAVPQEVERMLAAYLCAREGAPLLDDDRFFSTYVLLGKIIDQLRRGGED